MGTFYLSFVPKYYSSAINIVMYIVIIIPKGLESKQVGRLT